MSARGIIESEVWRSEQLEAAERESDPANPAVGESWVRVDINPSVDGAQALAELRIQGPTGVLQVPLIDIQDQPSLGPDVYVGPRCFLGSYVDNGLSGVGEIAFVPVTDQGGALGSPRVVTPAGVEFEAHDAVELSAIPDSVVNQWVPPNFASPWPDEIGGAHMSITGLTTTTINSDDFVTGDGSDDFGQASAPQLGNRETFGIATTFNANSADVSDFDKAFGLSDTTANDVLNFQMQSDAIEVGYRTDGDDLAVNSGSTAVADGSTHAIVINKNGNDATDWEIYVDDMSTDLSNVRSDQAGSDQAATYDPSNWTYSGDWGFWAELRDGSPQDHINASMGTVEFNTETYSQSERERFVSRRPEV